VLDVDGKSQIEALHRIATAAVIGSPIGARTADLPVNNP
jgi:hypothetical protein